MSDTPDIDTKILCHRTPAPLFEKVKEKYELGSIFSDDKSNEWIRLEIPEAKTAITWFKDMTPAE